MADIWLHRAFRYHPDYLEEPHRYFVISEPDEFNHVLTVMVSSIKYKENNQPKWHDKSCVLTPKDHASLTKNSYVAYNRAEWLECSQLSRNILNYDADISAELCERILWGALKSSRTSYEIRDDIEAMLREMLKAKKN